MEIERERVSSSQNECNLGRRERSKMKDEQGGGGGGGLNLGILSERTF